MIQEITILQQMTTGELAEQYAQLHGQPCRTRHQAYLIRKLAWRLQANAEGDLPERARRRAAELANDGDVQVMAPQTGEMAVVTHLMVTAKGKPIDPRLPLKEKDECGESFCSYQEWLGN